MHRHGYKGRKLSRERDGRRALFKSMASSLIEHEHMTTTLPKAKEIRPYVERLITKAKVGDLHARRQIIPKLSNLESAHKLVDDIAPLLTTRDSGYLRIVKQPARRGDNAAMARVEFVDDLDELRSTLVPKPMPTVKEEAPKAKKPVAKKETKETK
ncbi:50S ribosomal protein L17 [Candidatus Saccharibacteria bacterium]|nr:50S ribosomal protein L17 [Candidatus Saccharibacteria bacterium]